MSKFNYIILFIFLASSNNYVLAKDQSFQDLYSIEIIVFENLERNDLKEENFNQDLILTEPARCLKLMASNNLDSVMGLKRPAAVKLPERNFKLQKEAKLINSNSKYKLTMHEAWVQALYNGQRSLPVEIKLEPQITGYISIKPSGNLFHTNLDFLYKNTINENSTQSFRLQFKARMKKSELYYFDHPSVGILIEVSPYS